MGNNFSISRSLSVNNISNAITTNISSECSQNSAANVEFIIRGQIAEEGDINISGNTASQDISIDAKCVNDIINENNIKNIVSENIKKQIESMTEGVPLGTNVQTDINESINNIALEVTTTFVNTCSQTFSNDISLIIEGQKAKKGNININKNQVEQTLTIAAECINSNKNVSDMVNELDRKVKSKMKATNKGLFNNESLMSYSVFLIIIAMLVLMMG